MEPLTHGPCSTPSEYPRHAARGFREASGNIETLAEYRDRRDNLRSQNERAHARDALRPERQDRLSPGLELDQALGWLTAFMNILGKAVHSLKRAKYDKNRGKRPFGQSIDNKSRQGGPFVAVDSEGADFGVRFKRGDAEYQMHKSILWSVGGAEGFEDCQLRPAPGKQWVSPEEIRSYLTGRPRKFTKCGAAASIFISFAFEYDIGQIVADMPYEKAWELMHGLPFKDAWERVDGKRGKYWKRRKKPLSEPNFNRWVWWKNSALSYRPRRSITIARLKDRDNPSRPVKRKSYDHVSWETEIEPGSRIQIYDTFQFFRTSFLNALADFPAGVVVTPEELEIIKEGKAARGGFKAENLEKIARYTGLELKVLVRIIDEIRNALRTAIPGHPIELKDWWGAGAIASAVLDAFFKGKNVRAILGDLSQDSIQLQWARCAFYGGRIDPLQSGVTHRELFEYDLTSAYPYRMTLLPSMEGGTWEYVENPTREELEQSNILSMFEVHTSGCNPDLPFYPLPWRREGGAILFPRSVDGYYMRDHVIGAFKWFDEFTRRGTIGNYGLEPLGPRISIPRAWFFRPANPEERPFAFLKELFLYRAGLVEKDEHDIRAQVTKLGINAAYGKLAQSVGRKGHPPKYASPWMAAAITAGTQRMALEAALKDPEAIVRLATDAVQATRQLDMSWEETKILGTWMREIAIEGGMFFQAGIFCMPQVVKPGRNPKLKMATRGYSPENVEGDAIDHQKKVVDDLLNKIPEAWAKGEPVYSFKYKQYMSLGLALVSREAWKHIGYRKYSDRELELDNYGQKRNAPSTARKRQLRASKLVPLPVAHRDPIMEEGVMSAPYQYHWLSDAMRARDLEEEHLACVAGFN
jgi:hypothetical protein